MTTPHEAALSVRCAYTINGTQPVRCTIVGDDPQYYMLDIEDENDGFLI